MTKLKVMYGNKELFSMPVEKDWKATTVSFYHKGAEEIDDVAIWNNHLFELVREPKKKPWFRW